jgi:hypothetical protein
MNKRVLTTSLVLVLAMLVVLVIGKSENTSGPKPAQYAADVESTPNIDLTTDVAIISGDTGTFSGQQNAPIIPSEVNESELILDQELFPGQTVARESTTFLMDSLQRLQQALDGLKLAAANAEQAVVAIENQISSG